MNKLVCALMQAVCFLGGTVFFYEGNSSGVAYCMGMLVFWAIQEQECKL